MGWNLIVKDIKKEWSLIVDVTKTEWLFIPENNFISYFGIFKTKFCKKIFYQKYQGQLKSWLK